MKKVFAVVMAFMLAFTVIGTAFASGVKSPSLDSMMYFVPSYQWTYMVPAPAMENIEFAKEDLTLFLNTANYTIYEAFDLDVSYRYSIVKFVAPTIFPEANYIVLMFNDENIYMLTPILIDGDNGWETAVMDFTNIQTGIYHFYLICSQDGV